MSKDTRSDPPEKLLHAFDFAREIAIKESVHQEELRQLLMALLSVADSFDRLLSAAEGIEEPSGEDAVAWRRSAVLINKQLNAVLRDVGVEPVACIGRIADCKEHEIVDTHPDSESGEGVILNELVRGYEWRGMLLRRPRVIVAASPKE